MLKLQKWVKVVLIVVVNPPINDNALVTWYEIIGSRTDKENYMLCRIYFRELLFYYLENIFIYWNKITYSKRSLYMKSLEATLRFLESINDNKYI